MGDTQKISVIVTVHNHEKYIRECLDSVIDQTLPPHELIVIDSGSSDSTSRILQLWQEERQPDFTASIVSVPNFGPSFARNHGLTMATGAYIAFLDGDDYWLPQKLEMQVKVLIHSPFNNVGLVYSDYFTIEEDSEGVWVPNASTVPPHLRGEVRGGLRSGNFISGSASSALVTAKAARAAGQFDENLGFGEDWDYWRRIARKFEVDFAPEPLVAIRVVRGSWGSNPSLIHDEIRHFCKWIRRGEFSMRLYLQIVRKLIGLPFAIERKDWAPTERVLFSQGLTLVIGICDRAGRKLFRVASRFAHRIRRGNVE